MAGRQITLRGRAGSVAQVGGSQTGLTVDRTLQDRHVRSPVGDFHQVARDLLAPFDRVERGGNQAAAVDDHGGIGVEQADEGVDVPGIPCLLEGLHDVGSLCWRRRGSRRRADTTAG
jgi:hypothetical protein